VSVLDIEAGVGNNEDIRPRPSFNLPRECARTFLKRCHTFIDLGFKEVDDRPKSVAVGDWIERL